MPDALQSLAVLNKNLVAVKNSPGENVTITGENVTLPGASVGAISEVLLRYAPILDASGIDIGRAGNTSLVISSTAFTREVNQLENSKLLPGDYWVDYLSGLMHGRCATVSASITATYKIRRSNTSITGSVTILGTVPVSGTVAVSTLPAITGSVTITGTPTVIATGNVAAGATDSGNPVKTGAVYNATDPVYGDGQRTNLQSTTQGWLKVQEMRGDRSNDNVREVMKVVHQLLPGDGTYSPIVLSYKGTLATAIGRAGPTNLFSLYCTNDNAAKRWLHCFNRSTALAGGETPDYTLPLYPGINNFLGKDHFLEGGRIFSTGFTWAISSLLATYSATGVVAGEHVLEFNIK